MTMIDRVPGESVKLQLARRGPLVLLVAATASFILAIRGGHGILLGIVPVLLTLVLPGGYLLARRCLSIRHARELEERLVTHTRRYLASEEPVHTTPLFAARRLAPHRLAHVGKPVFASSFARRDRAPGFYARGYVESFSVLMEQ